jgi:G:T-mismatch repair DNA endonuclease (very short patch repair protein)
MGKIELSIVDSIRNIVTVNGCFWRHLSKKVIEEIPNDKLEGILHKNFKKEKIHCEID